ncbi:ecdysone-induced protein 78C-like [Anopheles albimanus]|uniref:MADF domain-containing protein n=1 Tax=Anopheles albimanus TaxID=7167 RepID=A0A182FUY5_ANOAL|nr:ecdysone-induced protein 78C-like [Anopheles albimanus]
MGPTKVTLDDQQFNIDFVFEVKKHICLFDSNNPEYKQAVMQDKAWQAVSQEVGESVDTCKKRWRNLRCCMTRYLKSVRDNTDLAANGRRKPYYLYNYMKFVIPYLKMKDENVSSYDSSSYDDPSWTKPNSSVGGSKDASTQGEEEDDDEVEDGPLHEIETIDVQDEEDPNQQELKQSIIQSIKILGQQPQTSNEQQQQQQQQQQPQPPQQITINDTSTPATANTTTTTYEIFTGPPVKQPRLTSSSSNCDSNSATSSHTAAIKKDLLNARQFITLTATAPNTTAVPVFHSPTITAQHQLAPISANYAQQAPDAQLQHQQHHQQQQQQPTTQQITFIPNAAPSQMPCDADHNFFQSLVPDIQSMTMEQKRKLKIGILQLIDNILNV